MLLPFRAATLPADVADFTLTQAVAALRRRVIRSEDLLHATRRRHECHAGYGAFICARHGQMEDERVARDGEAGGGMAGALQGVPVAVKDNVHVAGLANTAGTPALAHFEPARDAAVAARLRHAGAVIVGKTNMHELSLGVTSRNARYGDVRNARDPARIAGGSSGGSAVAVAQGSAYAALGTDTAGSIRIPAALNGVVGLRPTSGRYPDDGIVPVCPTRDTAGPMARTVADVALLDQVITGSQRPLAPVRPGCIRLGVVRDFFFEGLDNEVDAVIQSALRRLQDNGVQLIEFAMPGLADANDAAGTAVGFAEFWFAMQRYLDIHDANLSVTDLARQAAGDDVRYLIETFIAPHAPHCVPAGMYEAAIRRHRPSLRRKFLEQLCRHRLDAFILPTTLTVAAPLGGADATVAVNGQMLSLNYAYLRNTALASNAGLPALSLPAGYTAHGLPVGIEIDGSPHDDRRLLAIGQTIESILAVFTPALPISSTCP
jgi:mandelamide amidase